MKVKVIQATIKLKSFVMSFILSSLQESSSKASKGKCTLKVFSIKSACRFISLNYWSCTINVSRRLNKTTGCGNIHFIPIHWTILKKMSTDVSAFSYNCDLEICINLSFKSVWLLIKFSSVHFHTKFERNQSISVQIKSGVIFFLPSSMNWLMNWLM